MQELSSALRKRLADDTMESVLQYLEEHIYEQIPLTEAAQKSFMSVPHFCKRFKEYTGETYVKYVNNRRVEKIKEYLVENRFITTRALRLLFGLTQYTAQKWLKYFCEKGIMVKDGTRHSPIYFLKATGEA